MNGYDLSRAWFNFRYGRKNEVKPTHTELYFYIVDLWNRLGQPYQFGLPTDASMNALGVGSYNTYKKSLEGLIDFGFIIEVSTSKNQYQSRIIALSENDKALDKSLDKALIKASYEAPDDSLDKSSDSIIKQETINNKQLTKENNSRFAPPSLLEVENYISEKNYKQVTAASFWNFYESKNWMVGKNKMKDWKKAIAGWESRENEKRTNLQEVQKQHTGPGFTTNRPLNANRGTDNGYKPAAVNTEELIRELNEDFKNGNIPGQY